MIRRAEQKDVNAIFSLARSFATSFIVEEEKFHASFKQLSIDSSVYLAVAERESNVVGYILVFSHNTFYANGRVGWIEEIMVDEDYRNQGIGKSLMKSAEEWATNQDCKLIALATRRAANFYEALDYEASATYFRKMT